MTTAADFNTNALYPGGEGKCKVGTADLYPSDPWKVNVSMADLHKWMWNLEEWDVQFDCAAVLKLSPSDAEFLDVDLSLSGKFFGGDMHVSDDSVVFYWDATGVVLKSPPNKRVCGAYWRTDEGDGSSPTNTSGAGERLLFNCTASSLSYIDATRTESINISDGTGTVGTVSLTAITANTAPYPSYLDALISFYYVRLLGNGTADVYFTADCAGDFDASQVKITRLSKANDPTSGETATATTLTIFGSSVSAYIMTGSVGSPGPAPDSFSFSFALTVTTAYTY